MKAVIFGTTTLAAAAALGFYTWQTSNSGAHPCGDTAVAGSAIGGPFELISETGEIVTDADVITKPTLVYFGYTFCPDVCPLDSARNAQVAYMLEDQGLDLGTVFISVDPQRDTVEVVRDFTDNFHEDMIGLTGTPEQPRPI
jgi:protein SCO1/2